MSRSPILAAADTRSGIQIVALDNGKRADVDRFINVTRAPGIRALYAPYRDIWCPYTDDTLRATLSPRNPIWEHSDCQLFVATREGVDCGRILAVYNPQASLTIRQNTGTFGYFEAADLETARSLIVEAAWPWLKRYGVEAMIGNINPTTNDEVGVLIDGFHRHILLLEFNPPEYPKWLDELGLTKAMDVYSYTAQLTKEQFAPVFSGKGDVDDLERMAGLMCKRAGITLEYIDKRKIAQAASEFCAAYNRGWGDHWGYEPFTSAELLYLTKDLLTALPRELLILARNKEGKVIGAGLCAPDLNQVFRDFDGSLNILQLLQTMIAVWAPRWFPLRKRPTLMRAIGLGVLPEYARKGAAAAIMLKAIAIAMRMGYKEANASWILEDNLPMRAIPERFGLAKEQTWRLFRYAPDSAALSRPSDD